MVKLWTLYYIIEFTCQVTNCDFDNSSRDIKNKKF